MDTIRIRWGSSEQLETYDNNGATSASLIIKKGDEPFILFSTATFVDGIAVFELTSEDTEIDLGTYNYQINVEYPDGLEKYPDMDDCTGDCDFPELIICESLDMEEGS